MTIGQLHRVLLTELQKIYTTSEAGIISDWVFEKRASFSKGEIIKNSKELINKEVERKIREDLQRLLKHEPIQYILEEAWFYKMKLKVNAQVLIPRPETEELVEFVLEAASSQQAPINIIDIGSGSGCIAIALKKHLPKAIITAIDISEGALTIAKENASTQKVGIDFKQINFLDENEWKGLNQFGIIVSNPPYIPINEKEKLDKNVVDYEPDVALFVPANDPVLFYKKIIFFGKKHLINNGKIFVEVHENFAKEIFDLFASTYIDVTIKNDMYGKPRMLMATSCP